MRLRKRSQVVEPTSQTLNHTSTDRLDDTVLLVVCDGSLLVWKEISSGHDIIGNDTSCTCWIGTVDNVELPAAKATAFRF